MISQSELKPLISYDKNSGNFYWKPRCIELFKTERAMNVFNSSMSGKVAGCKITTRKGKSYIAIRINKKLYFAHRLAWLYVNGCMPDEIDHQDGNGLNNKICNLLNTDRQGNSRNHRVRTTNTSGVTGVTKRKDTGKWCSRITIDGKEVNLGCFSDFFEACCARKSAERKYGFHINHGSVRPL